jgi:hypothetical protein
MTENTQSTNPFANFFTDPEKNPFAKMFAELNAPLCGSLKQAAAQSIDTSEEWARKAIELNEKVMAWAKTTPLAPLFEAQRSLATRVIESSATFARSLWRVEPKSEEKSA